MSYELIQNKDVRLELDVNRETAAKFLRKYGRKMINVLFIPRREFRQLQLDGTVAEFMRGQK